MAASIETTQKDYFTARPLVVPVSAAFAVGTIFSFWTETEVFFLLAGLAVIPAWVVSILVRAFLLFWRGTWRRASSLLLVLPIAWQFGPLVAKYPPSYVHLLVMYPYYETHLNTSPNGHLLETRFDWGSTGFVSTIQTIRTLVYDPNDKPEEDQANLPAWHDRLEKQHLFGHYYLEIFTQF